MSKKLKFDKVELDHAFKSFGYANYDKNTATVRGNSELDPCTPSEELVADMQKLLKDSGRADDLLILNKNK